MAEIEIRLFRKGRSVPFSEWFASLKDVRSRAAISARLNRVRRGNFGDCKSVGDGVDELRVDHGPGYRVYFGRQGSVLVILLGAGTKNTQSRDIAIAKERWKEYRDAEGQDQH